MVPEAWSNEPSRPVELDDSIRKDVTKLRWIVGLLSVLTIGSFSVIVAEGSLVNTRYRAALCRNWKFREENENDCNGVVVSFPTVVLITSVLSLATLASLWWLAVHMVRVDLSRGGSDMSTMLVIYLVIKVMFLGLHATFIGMTWYSEVPTPHEFGLVVLGIDMTTVILALFSWTKAARMQERMIVAARSQQIEWRSTSLDKLPTASYEEMQADTGSGRLQENCVICLSDFEPSCEVTRLACGHVFHAGCIKNWLVRSGHDQCPYRCREDPLEMEPCNGEEESASTFPA
mmetsp:Transcript_12012/g.22635  ORF Transcript_12012/g.22635 Transcript_12012/m.22635 type:complete len:289 (-) Transcript_12012:223-1089(-)